MPLVKQIARWSAELDRQFASYLVGDGLPAAPNLPREEALTVTLPNGVAQPLGAGEWVVERADQAGIYTVTSPREGTVQQFAVNLDPRALEELLAAGDDTDDEGLLAMSYLGASAGGESDVDMDVAIPLPY